MKNKTKHKIIILLAISVFLINTISVSAFGVVTPYFEGNELRMYPGEKVITNVTLQNMVGSQDLTFKAEIPMIHEAYATLTDENSLYEVPLGKDDINVPLIITIPRKAKIGENLLIEIQFTQTNNDNTGTVTLQTGFNTHIPLHIVQKEKSTYYDKDEEKDNTILLTVAILITLLVILYTTKKIIQKRKKHNKKHKHHTKHAEHKRHQHHSHNTQHRHKHEHRHR